ncbi:MAG: hypothetical protein EHM93_00065 [Bacteroidales bacterium]|nr:MAG: hypothetical protein EHM93_00065 [Bacteroidales bacterium]
MQKNRIILLFCFIIANSSLFSQDWNKILLYQNDAETYMFDKQYDKAAETFKKASKIVPDNANFKFKIGYCYLRTDDKKKEAIGYLEDAVKNVSPDYKEKSLKEPKAPTLALYLLAEAYRIDQQFDEAAETYVKYKEFLKPDDNLRALVDQNIASCKNANELIKDSVSVKITNLGNTINNEFPNINAVVSGDGKTLAFTTINKLGNDIFISNKVNNIWSAPKKITTQLGNKYLLTCFLSFNGKDLYLSSDNPENNDIFVTTIEGNKWIQPLQFEKPINTKSNETHVCLTKDGNTIYFTSDRKGGLGGLDIYKATVNEKGLWGEPVNLGSGINTPFNEVTPFLTPDEKYLFFSSEGRGGLGGYDIFYVNLEGSQKVQTLNYPINNSDNNQFYFPENGLKSGFISFYDKNSIGRRDINHIEMGRFTNLNGKILAESNDSGKPFKISIFDTSKNDTIAKLESTSNMSFSYRIDAGTYQVLINNSKYLPFSKEFTIAEDFNGKEFPFEAKMQPIPVEKPKLIAEVLPVAVKKDTATVEKTKPVKIAETPKKEVKTEPAKPKEKITEKVKVKVENTVSSTSEVRLSIYAVQLMALKTDIGADYFKDIDNIEITLSPEGFYRYSVGSTESMEDAMATLGKVKALGYTKAYVRIDMIDAAYTIQLMASNKPIALSTFNNISGVNENHGSDGLYRYTVGSFANYTDAKGELSSIIESGYNKAFIKKVRIK